MDNLAHDALIKSQYLSELIPCKISQASQSQPGLSRSIIYHWNNALCQLVFPLLAGTALQLRVLSTSLMTVGDAEAQRSKHTIIIATVHNVS